MKIGNSFGYLQCNIEAPDKLKPHFVISGPFFKNTPVDLKDNRNLMKQYAEEESLVTQHQKKLISSLNTQSVCSLLLCYCSIKSWDSFVDNHFAPLSTIQKYFNNFVQSAVSGRRHCDKNPNPSIVAET